jgi:hypothetical protein
LVVMEGGCCLVEQGWSGLVELGWFLVAQGWDRCC